MSLSIIDYPVKSIGQNIFGGLSPIEIKFKREDLSVVDTELGVNGTLIINIGAGNISALNVGEYVYLKSENYDLSAEVLEITNDFIRVDYQWSNSTAGGYINYKQDYYIEIETINPENELIKILPFTLTDDGDNEGNITIDLSIINDLNKLELPSFVIGEMTDSRVKFDIKYREIWRESTETAYLRVTDPIIIYPAKETGTIEDFTNGLDQPEYYVGYPNRALFLHSDSDPLGGELLAFYIDELDINKEAIKENSFIGSISAIDNYGRIIAPLVDLDLLDDTEYIDIKKEAENIPEYSDEYNDEYQK